MSTTWQMMKGYLFHVLIIAYLSAGCGATYQVGGPSPDLSLDDAADVLVGEEVTVFTARGEKRQGTILALNNETLCYQPFGYDSLASLKLKSLERVEVPLPTGNYIGGGLLGCLVGAAAGGGIAAAATSGESILFDEGVAQEVTTLVVAGGTIGYYAGHLIVASSGPDVFEFPSVEAQLDSLANK